MKTKKFFYLRLFSDRKPLLLYLFSLPYISYGGGYSIVDTSTLIESGCTLSLFYYLSNSLVLPMSGAGICLLAIGYLINHLLRGSKSDSNKIVNSKIANDQKVNSALDTATDNIKDSFLKVMQPLSKLASSNDFSAKDEILLAEVAASASSLLTSINTISLLYTTADHDKSDTQEVSLYHFSRDAVSLFEYFAKLRHISLRFSFLVDRDMIVQIRADRLQLVLYNLIFNALKYTDRDGSVTLIVDNIKSDIRFTVRDTGIGVNDEEKEKVFEQGYRGIKAQSKSNIGSGMGLTFVKREVEQLLKGKVSIESLVGSGSDIIVDVPLVEMINTENHQEKKEKELTSPEDFIVNEDSRTEEKAFNASSQMKSILICDEENLIGAEVLVELSSLYNVDVVNNLIEVSEKVKNDNYDLILLDLLGFVDGRHYYFQEICNIANEKNIEYLFLSNALNNESVNIKNIDVNRIVFRYYIDNELFVIISSTLDVRPFRRNLDNGSVEKKNIINNNKRLESNNSVELEKGAKNNVSGKIISLKNIEWLEQMDQDILVNLSNMQYGVEALADNMNISRTHLFRKIKKLTGESPNGYIREKKLVHAKYLLDTGACKSVKEVSNNIGILKTSYFTKLFFNRFGIKPSSYLH